MGENKTYVGTIWYASKDAQSKRYYFEGRKIGTNNYKTAVMLDDNKTVQLDLDSSGTNYIHLQLA